MNQVRMLVVPADMTKPIEVRTVTPDIGVIKEAIGGGWLEGITGEDWHAYLDEDGKGKGLPVNVRASVIADRGGWFHHGTDFLVGDVVFLGNTSDGEEGDVPEGIIAAWGGDDRG